MARSSAKVVSWLNHVQTYNLFSFAWFYKPSRTYWFHLFFSSIEILTWTHVKQKFQLGKIYNRKCMFNVKSSIVWSISLCIQGSSLIFLNIRSPIYVLENFPSHLFQVVPMKLSISVLCTPCSWEGAPSSNLASHRTVLFLQLEDLLPKVDQSASLKCSGSKWNNSCFLLFKIAFGKDI